MNCLTVFDHFVGWALIRLMSTKLKDFLLLRQCMVQRSSCLSNLKSYHVTNDLDHDFAHDVFEGFTIRLNLRFNNSI